MTVRLAEQLGLAESIEHAIDEGDERWDGRGMPYGIKGENIMLPIRAFALAQDSKLFQRKGIARHITASIPGVA